MCLCTFSKFNTHLRLSSPLPVLLIVLFVCATATAETCSPSSCEQVSKFVVYVFLLLFFLILFYFFLTSNVTSLLV